MDPLTALAVASLVARLLGGVAETARNVKDIRDAKRDLWDKVKGHVDDGLDEMDDRYNVRWAQDALNAIGGYKLYVDGWYGTATRRAVADFQSKHNLEHDGNLGPITLATLIVELKKLEQKAKAALEHAKLPPLEE